MGIKEILQNILELFERNSCTVACYNHDNEVLCILKQSQNTSQNAHCNLQDCKNIQAIAKPHLIGHFKMSSKMISFPAFSLSKVT